MQAVLEVGFGRRLHVPQQVTQSSAGFQSSPQTHEAATSQAGTPAALFEFEQLCGQQVCNALFFNTAYWMCKE